MAEGSHESPWTRASGGESAVRVRGLAEGDRIAVHVKLEPEGDLLLFFSEGITPLKPFSPRDWMRYRVVKQAGDHRSMTVVEVLLGSY
jgi:hypothetical protein